MILFTPAQQFIPIAHALQQKGHNIATLSGPFTDTLRKLDIPARTIGDWGNGLQEQALIEAGKIVKSAMSPVSTAGLGVGPTKFMEEKRGAFIYNKMHDLALLTLCLDKAQPELAIMQNDVEPLNRVIALWCDKNRVPCLHVPHAVYQDINRGPAGTDIHDKVTASHIAVAGSFQHKWYQMRGVSPGHMAETGLPQFDRWAKGPIERQRAQRLLKLDPEKPTIIYGSTWPQGTNILGINDEWMVTYLSFLEAVKSMSPQPNVLVIVHRSGGEQNWQWHVQVAQNMGVKAAISPHHFDMMLAAGDAFLAFGGSNMLLDGSHVPGLRLLSTHGYDNDPEVTRVEMNPADIKAKLQAVLSAPRGDLGRFQTKWLGWVDGGNAGRVVAFADGLAGRKLGRKRRRK